MRRNFLFGRVGETFVSDIFTEFTFVMADMEFVTKDRPGVIGGKLTVKIDDDLRG